MIISIRMFNQFLFYLHNISTNKMDLIPKMERVYIPSTEKFGHVVKKGGIFGVKDSFTIIDDAGGKSIYIGKNIGNFIFTESGKNCVGKECAHEIPVDGYQIIKKEFPRCTKFLSTYYDMSLDQRNDLMLRWATMKKSQKDALIKGKK